MSGQRRYSDQRLAAAVAAAHSWRGVLRELGLPESSSGAIRSARNRAQELSLDFSHFMGQRTWTEESLRLAVAGASSWDEVAGTLGATGSAAASTLEGHSTRLGISSQHFNSPQAATPIGNAAPSAENLDRAGSLLAATWFTLSGYSVSWPLEPARFDLLVTRAAVTRRVQVKTTRVRVGNTWKVYLSTSRGQRVAYRPDEIDDFFIVNSELECYAIPFAAVGGLHAIHLQSV